MNAKRIIAVLNECATNGTDAYGLAIEVAQAVEADTREGLAQVTDSLGMTSVSEAVRQGTGESIEAAILSVVAGLVQRHAAETEAMQAELVVLRARLA